MEIRINADTCQTNWKKTELGDDFDVTVLDIKGDQVSVGITAPEEKICRFTARRFSSGTSKGESARL